MQRFRIPVFAVLLELLVAQPVRAEEFRICFEDWEPFATVVEGRPAGLMIDVMDRALAASGHSAVYSLQPYQRCIGNVRAGRYDAMLMTSGEQGLAPTSVSVAFWEVGVIARPDWPSDRYDSLDDFTGARVGLVGAYVYHPAVQEAQQRWQVEYTSDAAFNLRKVSQGRIDLTIADIPWARTRAAEEGLDVKILSPPLFATPQHTYFHPRYASVAAAVDDRLRGLLADGTIDRLYRQTFGHSFETVSTRAAEALFDG